MNLSAYEKIHFGVDYYPEHWPKERWKKDATLMKELGIDVIRIAEFSWSKYEPEEGKYDFSLIDEVIELMSEYEFKIILGTPSAAPPAWLIKKYPDVQPIDYEGKRRHFGGRHHACQSNKHLRDYIDKYVNRFADHFSDNENVFGWQIDNELGNSHGDLCYCDSCQEEFRKWLKNKYGTINELNEKWGTVFWSQGYRDFDEIIAPKITVTGRNPSQILDWKLFCSDLIVDFHKHQSSIIRRYSDKPITHNFMGFANKVNYFDLAEDLEFVSHDQYPGLFHTDFLHVRNSDLAAALDLMRGTKKQPYWIMEQQSGITGWEIMGRSPKPGQLSLWAGQSIAHGADCVVFFRWRNCIYGTEQYWHGILPHSGIPGRNYNELKEFINKFKPLMEKIKGAMPQNKVGIVFSYNQEYALEIQPHHPDFSYTEQVKNYYNAFHSLNIPVDFLSEDSDFENYNLIVAPSQYLMSDKLEDKYCEYVNQGGQLILTMRSGVKDENNICRTSGSLPCGRLTELLGIEILEYDCLRDVLGTVVFENKNYDVDIWADILSLRTAKELATYGFEYYQGEPSITVNEFGRGKAYYIGTNPSKELLIKFIKLIGEDIDLNLNSKLLIDGVEFVSRQDENTEYIFALNHNEKTVSFERLEGWVDYFEEQSSKIKPYQINVYKKSL